MAGASIFDSLSIASSNRSAADGGVVSFDSSGWTVATASANASAARGEGAGLDFGPVLVAVIALAGLALVLRAKG